MKYIRKYLILIGIVSEIFRCYRSRSGPCVSESRLLPTTLSTGFVPAGKVGDWIAALS